MNDEQIRLHFQAIRQRIAKLQQHDVEAWQDIDAALENLYLIYEEMQSRLETAEIVEQGLIQQNQQIGSAYYHYYELFQASPIPYLAIDADGIILEANSAIAQLLEVPQPYLIGKPLILYIAPGDRSSFYLKLDRLPQTQGIQIWQMHLRSRANELFAVELHIDTLKGDSDTIERFAIGIYPLSPTQHQPLAKTVPQSLDGLRVLVVDDEADARDFISAVLELHGIAVKAVASAADALEAIEEFSPDVLVSDIRMPGEDGYTLIRKIRALEALKGGHLRAGAITAYRDEDCQKALSAGFEAHLNKLAEPSQLIEMVSQLARLP
ncbi:MAG: response regulator [Desertifilum sp. SIO1I2]|nr:response regulator [Desertifilum sp. SIO1I2]